MSNESQTPTKRRWFRFSLRTLLIVVALAAVGSWAYWIGWPWWVAYREQARVETAIRHLKAGTLPFTAYRSLQSAARSVGRPVTFERVFDDTHPEVVLIPYVTERAIYCIYFVLNKKTHDEIGAASTSLEAFRVPRMPKNYQPKTPSGDGLELDYISDFFLIHTGDSVDDHRIQYELIYSDPPQNDKPL